MKKIDSEETNQINAVMIRELKKIKDQVNALESWLKFSVENKPELTVTDGIDPLYHQAVEIVTQIGKASASLLQRRLSIGYARAAYLIDKLEQHGVVSKADGSKPRELLSTGGDKSSTVPGTK